LANLSGVSIDQVVVVPGKRAIPLLPKQAIEEQSIENIVNIDKGKHFSAERYSALVRNKYAIKWHPSFFGLHFFFKKMPLCKLTNLNKGIIPMVKKSRLLNPFLLNLSFVRI